MDNTVRDNRTEQNFPALLCTYSADNFVLTDSKGLGRRTIAKEFGKKVKCFDYTFSIPSFKGSNAVFYYFLYVGFFKGKIDFFNAFFLDGLDRFFPFTDNDIRVI